MGSLPHCHHHGPTGDDPYPAEGKKGCPSEKSPKGPKKCDASAAAPHASYDTDKYSFNGTMITAKKMAAIQQAIMAGGPVETAFSVYDDFEDYAGGIYHHVTGKFGGGHAVKFVGWGVENGTKYWKVANPRIVWTSIRRLLAWIRSNTTHASGVTLVPTSGAASTKATKSQVPSVVPPAQTPW